MVCSHPLFYQLARHVTILRSSGPYPVDGWAVVSNRGYIYCHPGRRGSPEGWAWVIAHCLLHLGLGHFQAKGDRIAWNAACDCCVAGFLDDLKIVRPPDWLGDIQGIPSQSEEKLYEIFMASGLPWEMRAFGTAGGGPDMIDEAGVSARHVAGKAGWPSMLAEGMSAAVKGAVMAAGGATAKPACMSAWMEERKTRVAAARDWIIDSFPLLGALAANFRIVEDPLVCSRMDISVAAIDVSMGEIYMNPAAGLTQEECRFVLAHEFLHAGLGHAARACWRDPFLWNVACDYVINGWLVEMGVGIYPSAGILHDAGLGGLSAEAVYDRIVGDIRAARKLATLRGSGLGDILYPGVAGPRETGEGLTLDEFYRSCLAQGLDYHLEGARGYIPAGLIEEIRSISQPPIAWDVELARWFDAQFEPLEKYRSFARLSRRQMAAPDIPRPSWMVREYAEYGRVFGVLLDTSGSMERGLLARALGAVAAYSASRDVPAVRVIFCDAAVYDQGWMRPEDIAGTVRVRGRGGTVLQPGIEHLDSADDFPRDAPLLVITDGYCDVLSIKGREHAFLISAGARLPFPPRGKVFRLG
jgi:predicted metal-dependent peptidase